MGYTLTPSHGVKFVYAVASHALPVLRCPATALDAAEIKLHTCCTKEHALARLQDISRQFMGLWPDFNNTLVPPGTHNNGFTENSFKVVSAIICDESRTSLYSLSVKLFSMVDVPKRVFVQPMISPAEWNETIFRITTRDHKKPPVVFICGPKNAGKSTFAKLLTNRLLVVAEEKSTTKGKELHASNSAMYLDVDPGQPEYSLPGNMTLCEVSGPNLGPSFSHPWGGEAVQVIRAHALGALTPAADLELFTACLQDLFENYKARLAMLPDCALVVNTPGWILGTGLEILLDTIRLINPTEIVYMSQAGPEDVVESLRGVSASTPFHTLPSQPSQYTPRTAAQLRTMQYQSYFHTISNSNRLQWLAEPLDRVRPIEIRYSGIDCGIWGVLCYGEKPESSLLAYSINGAVLALVAADTANAFMVNSPKSLDRPFEDHLRCITSSTPPKLIRTSLEDLPYFDPTDAAVLHPQNTSTLGSVLIRGIDHRRRRLQVITPIPLTQIESTLEMGKSLILVHGKLDTPGWAYTENMVFQATQIKSQTLGEGSSREAVTKIPWVERLAGSKGRDDSARIWRVRRDLGKSKGE